jgi:3-oxoadipate enol-lactonase
MRWAEAGGVALRFEITGAGQTTVLIHEAGGSLESWDAVAPGFAGDGRVLRYDQRGFGLSERVTALSLENMVADLIALLDVMAIGGRCRLLGTAIGGTIALALAAWHPDRVAAVVATSPVTGGLSAAAAAGLEQRAQLLEHEGMRAVADASLQRSYPERFRSDPDKFEQYRLRFMANDPRSFAALSRTYSRIDLESLYARIHCPALIIGCTGDPIKPAEECRALASRLQRARYQEIDSAHFIGLVSPRRLIDAARDFFDRQQWAVEPSP